MSLRRAVDIIIHLGLSLVCGRQISVERFELRSDCRVSDLRTRARREVPGVSGK